LFAENSFVKVLFLVLSLMITRKPAEKQALVILAFPQEGHF